MCIKGLASEGEGCLVLFCPGAPSAQRGPFLISDPSLWSAASAQPGGSQGRALPPRWGLGGLCRVLRVPEGPRGQVSPEFYLLTAVQLRRQCPVLPSQTLSGGGLHRPHAG